METESLFMNNTQFIITWIMALVTFLLGYALGNGSLTRENITLAIKKTKRSIMGSGDVGAVRRPTAQQMYERNNPLVQAETEAMRESMRDIPK